MKKYDYILFDWDGCLAKTLDIHLESYKKTFAEHGVYPSDKEIVQEAFGDWSGPKKIGIKDLKGFNERYIKRVSLAYSQVVLYRNVRETLEKLKSRGKKIALITTSLRTVVSSGLQNNKLDHFFDVELYAEDVEKHKPDSEMLNKAIIELNGVKDRAIIVGDSKSDLGAAINTEIDSILFYPEHNKLFYDLESLKLFNPTYIVYKFEEILKIII